MELVLNASDEVLIQKLESKIIALEELVAAQDDEITSILHQECGLDEEDTVKHMNMIGKWRSKAFALLVSEKGQMIDGMRHTRFQQKQIAALNGQKIEVKRELILQEHREDREKLVKSLSDTVAAAEKHIGRFQRHGIQVTQQLKELEVGFNVVAENLQKHLKNTLPGLLEDTMYVILQKIEPISQKLVRLTNHVACLQKWNEEFKKEGLEKEESFKKESESKNKEINKLQEYITHLKEANTRISQDRDKLILENMDKVNQIEAMENRVIEESLLERNKLIVQLENQKYIVRGYHNEIDILKKHIEEEKQSTDSLKEALECTESKLVERETEVAALRNSLQEFIQQQKKETGEIIQSLENNKNQAVQELTQENSKLKQDHVKNLYSLRSLEQQLNKQKDIYQEYHNKAVAKLSELETKLTHKNDQIHALKLERDELMAIIKGYQGQKLVTQRKVIQTSLHENTATKEPNHFTIPKPFPKSSNENNIITKLSNLAELSNSLLIEENSEEEL